MSRHAYGETGASRYADAEQRSRRVVIERFSSSRAAARKETKQVRKSLLVYWR